MSGTAATARRRPAGWKLLGLNALVLVFAAAGAFAWWMSSDADLRAVEARARALDVPVAWEEMGLKRSDEARVAVWRRLAELVKPEGLAFNSVDGRGSAFISPRCPLKQIVAFLKHHYEHQGPRIEAILCDVDLLGPDPLCLAPPVIDPHGRFARQSLVEVIGEQVIMSPGSDLPEQVRRLLDCVESFQPVDLDEQCTACHVLRFANVAFTLRLADLRGNAAAADRLVRIADQMRDHLNTALAGEFCAKLAALRPTPGAATGTGRWAALVRHAARRPLLDAVLDVIVEVRTLPAPQLVARLAEASARMEGRPKWDIRYRLIRGAAWEIESRETVERTIRDTLHARLVAAEIAGSSWPLDEFDASGKSLRRLERDGKLIGAYSVGPDGVDDDGDDLKDWTWLLYAPVEKAHP